jgi:hypothetical protein
MDKKMLPELPWVFEGRDGDDPLVKRDNGGWGCYGCFSKDYIIMATSGWDNTLDYPEDFHERFLNYLLASEEAKEVMQRFKEENDG